MVEILFVSADGQEQRARVYHVDDWGDFLGGYRDGQHARIVDGLMPSILRELGPGARYLSTSVDGVVQPD